MRSDGGRRGCLYCNESDPVIYTHSSTKPTYYQPGQPARMRRKASNQNDTSMHTERSTTDGISSPLSAAARQLSPASCRPRSPHSCHTSRQTKQRKRCYAERGPAGANTVQKRSCKQRNTDGDSKAPVGLGFKIIAGRKCIVLLVGIQKMTCPENAHMHGTR